MNDWRESWIAVTGLPSETPGWLVAICALAALYAFVIIPSGAAVSILDRKLGADLQARVGPNRAGRAGVLQPLADFLKLVQKRNAQETGAAQWVWLLVHVAALFGTVAVLPLGSMILMVDTDMSALLPFWSTFVLALGTMFLGFNLGSISGWFGGIRVASQALAAGFPALITILSAGAHAGGFRWSAFAACQGFGPWSWALFSNPFQLIGGATFIASGAVLLGIFPMDSGAASREIHGGVASHLAGIQFLTFRFARYYVFFLWSVITVVLFLGAWRLPADIEDALRGHNAITALILLELGVILFKAISVMLGIGLISRVVPRLRSDQATDFAWQILSPAALLALVGTTLWIGGL